MDDSVNEVVEEGGEVNEALNGYLAVLYKLLRAILPLIGLGFLTKYLPSGGEQE